MFSIAYLGNSVTAQRNSYVEPLHELLRSKWGQEINMRKAGLGGVGSLALAGLLDYLILRHEPLVCFVETSLADAGGATPTSMIPLGVRSIFHSLLSSAITPIVIHLPRTDVPGGKAEEVTAIYNSVAQEFDIQVIDIRHVDKEIESMDGVHTTPHSSLRIANEIANNLGNTAPMAASKLTAGSSAFQEIIFIPSSEGECLTGTAKASNYRLVLPTVTVANGGVFRFHPTLGRYVGVYVIAQADSGVIHIRSSTSGQDIQVWDRWCDRARIQFIPLPNGFAQRDFVEITATDLEIGTRNCQGDSTTDHHVGTSVEILGAAVSLHRDYGMMDPP